MRKLESFFVVAAAVFAVYSLPLAAEEGEVLAELEMSGDVDPESLEVHHHCHHCHNPHVEFFYWGPYDDRDDVTRELDHDTSWAGEREDDFYDNLTR